MTVDLKSVTEIRSALAGIMGCQHLDDSLARLKLRTIRALALGTPVPVERMGPAATDDRVPLIRLGAEFDDAGRIVGFGGLTLRETRHRFRLGDRQLYTWCAVDTLFLPAILGERAFVESPCPVTDTIVRAEVEADGVRSIDPDTAVVSLIVPDPAETESCCAPEEGDTCPDMRALVGRSGGFCSNVFFLASASAGRRWQEQYPNAVIVSVADASSIGRHVWADPLRSRVANRLADGAA